MAVKTKVRGLVELRQRLALLRSQEEIDKITYRGTYGIAKEFLQASIETAKFMIQEQTGDLIRNIAMKRIAPSKSLRGYTIGVRAGAPRQIKSGTDPFYWWWVHFGTARMAPRPFFTIAFKEVYGRAYGVISNAALKAISDAVDRAVKRYQSKGK